MVDIELKKQYEQDYLQSKKVAREIYSKLNENSVRQQEIFTTIMEAYDLRYENIGEVVEW
jgi:formiminotetrahydrofolate cyclodeaminase